MSVTGRLETLPETPQCWWRHSGSTDSCCFILTCPAWDAFVAHSAPSSGIWERTGPLFSLQNARLRNMSEPLKRSASMSGAPDITTIIGPKGQKTCLLILVSWKIHSIYQHYVDIQPKKTEKQLTSKQLEGAPEKESVQVFGLSASVSFPPSLCSLPFSFLSHSLKILLGDCVMGQLAWIHFEGTFSFPRSLWAF